MTNVNKLGAYINRLMTTVLDKDQEEFVRDLAISDLSRLGSDIQEFIRKHQGDDEEKSKETVKQLLQEEVK